MHWRPLQKLLMNSRFIYDGITSMEKFSGTTTEITIKNHHTWVCPVYVLYEILQVKIAGLTEWEPCSCTGIYFCRSPFHAGSVFLVLNPATVHVSSQFHVVFYVDFSTVTFIREGKIQRISQSGAPDNIYFKDTWFTPDIEEYPRETPSCVSSN